MSKRTKAIAGVMLAGFTGPAFGIYGNSIHSTSIQIPAVLISLTGVYFLLIAIYTKKQNPDNTSTKDSTKN